MVTVKDLPSTIGIFLLCCQLLMVKKRYLRILASNINTLFTIAKSSIGCVYCAPPYLVYNITNSELV